MPLIKFRYNTLNTYLRYNTLGSLIEFKHLFVLNLIVLKKDNTILILLVNATKNLNLIRKNLI